MFVHSDLKSSFVAAVLKFLSVQSDSRSPGSLALRSLASL